MTDDKVAGDNPYFHDIFCVSSCIACAWKEGFSEGRKDERERCAHIAEHEAGEIPECMTGRIIAEKIRGGQDGK
jgi:hypothetical protein